MAGADACKKCLWPAGDRVAVFSPNSIEWIMTMYATAKIGAILVPLNPSYKDTELARALLHSKANMLVSAATCKGVDMLQTVSAAVHCVLSPSCASAKQLESLVLVGNTPGQEEAGAPPPPPPPPACPAAFG